MGRVQTGGLAGGGSCVADMLVVRIARDCSCCGAPPPRLGAGSRARVSSLHHPSRILELGPVMSPRRPQPRQLHHFIPSVPIEIYFRCRAQSSFQALYRTSNTVLVKSRAQYMQ
jgi:hypothetical protein